MCDVCKRESFSMNKLYSYTPKFLKLCKEHDRQLFLRGETAFINMFYYQIRKKYKKIESNYNSIIKPCASHVELSLTGKK